MIDIEKMANEFIFSDRGRELNAFINDNQGQMSANKLLREVFKAGYKAKKVNMNNTPIDIEKLAEEHLTPFARTGWAAYGEQIKQFAEAYSAKVHDKRVGELEAKNRELSASINDLREAFRKIRSCYGDGYEVDNIARQALSKTPAQSLIEHDNEVIEMCAKVCDEASQPNKDEIHTDAQWAAKVLAANIHALKGNT